MMQLHSSSYSNLIVSHHRSQIGFFSLTPLPSCHHVCFPYPMWTPSFGNSSGNLTMFPPGLPLTLPDSLSSHHSHIPHIYILSHSSILTFVCGYWTPIFSDDGVHQTTKYLLTLKNSIPERTPVFLLVLLLFAQRQTSRHGMKSYVIYVR